MKNKSNTKVEVVIGNKVFAECNGVRKDGTCGNKYCEAFNKSCVGINTCRHVFGYYTIENGGGYWQPTKDGHDGEGAVATQAEETPCIHLGGEDYCADYKAEKITCDKCQKWVDACQELRAGSSAVAVVEPRGGAVGMTEQDIAAGISRQCTIIEEAEKNAEHERIKLGIVLIRWEQYLGESRGGRGKSGNGLKGWLEKNVPKLNYQTAQNYKHQAEKAITMSGGGAHAQAALMGEPTVTQPNGDVIDVDATYVKKANEVIENADSRRKLEQQYFEFMAKQGKKRQGGANKGQSGTGRRALTPVEKAEDADVEIRQLIGKIIAFDKGEKFRMLTAQTQNDIILAMKDLVRSFEEQQA